MLRIATILSAVFFASIQCDVDLRANVESFRLDAIGYIDHAVGTLFKQKFKNYPSNYQQKHDEILGEILHLSDDVSEKIGLLKQKMEIKMENISSKVLECVKAAVLYVTGNARTIDMLFENTHQQLLTAKGTIQHCNANRKSTEAAMHIHQCIESGKKEAEKVSSTMEPQIESKIAEVDGFLKNVIDNLKICTIGTGIETADTSLSAIQHDID